ncbi:hypothetical protein CAEBREN_23208 [Caenorhabditis brenneri]|uniref:Uncharacterized protein n=1 Tax=Caenorhabditis brenneri TaxID=135651 RepID=G0NB97_CAEBE|nr:hypothetical protein CAEBREN_23208 [Caenorhabditis brenneri]
MSEPANKKARLQLSDMVQDPAPPSDDDGSNNDKHGNRPEIPEKALHDQAEIVYFDMFDTKEVTVGDEEQMVNEQGPEAAGQETAGHHEIEVLQLENDSCPLWRKIRTLRRIQSASSENEDRQKKIIEELRRANEILQKKLADAVGRLPPNVAEAARRDAEKIRNLEAELNSAHQLNGIMGYQLTLNLEAVKVNEAAVRHDSGQIVTRATAKAENIVAASSAEAEQLAARPRQLEQELKDAQAKLEEVLVAARHEADQIIGMATAEAKKIVAAASAEAEQFVARPRKLEQELKDTQAKLEEVRRQLEDTRLVALATEVSTADVLVVARREADQIVARATAKAQEIVAAATVDAEQLVDIAQLDADDILEEAQSEADQKLEDAQNEVDKKLNQIRKNKNALKQLEGGFSRSLDLRRKK